jgi:hypothetical protein
MAMPRRRSAPASVAIPTYVPLPALMFCGVDVRNAKRNAQF